jgi:hypothetical protein
MDDPDFLLVQGTDRQEAMIIAVIGDIAAARIFANCFPKVGVWVGVARSRGSGDRLRVLNKSLVMGRQWLHAGRGEN